jgi:hypothetical protein
MTAAAPKPLPIYCELPWNMHKGHEPDYLPDYTHRWWRRPGVIPIIKLALPWMNGVHVSYLAEDVAVAVRDFAKRIGVEPRNLEWAFMPAYIGRGPHNGGQVDHEFQLFDHPADRTVMNGRHYWGPWAHEGIRANRDWMLAFAPCLVASLSDKGLRRPKLMAIASEAGPGDITAEYDADMRIPAWAVSAARDWRSKADDHAVKPGTTYRDMVNLMAPGPDPVMPAVNLALYGLPPARNPLNHAAREQWEGLRRVVDDHARFEGIVMPWQRSFPEVPVVEFAMASDGGAHAGGTIPCLPPGPNLRPQDTKLWGMRGFFRTPLQGPAWYGELGQYDDEASDRDLSIRPENWSTKSRWMDEYSQAYRMAQGPQTGLSLFEFAAISKALAVLQAHGRSNKAPLCPWTSLSHGITDRQMTELLRWLETHHAGSPTGGAGSVHGLCVWEEGHHWSTAVCDRWAALAEQTLGVEAGA